MRILVTGGAGFVGSHVVEALEAEGHEVVVLDRRPPRPGVASSVRWVEGDVAEVGAWERALDGGVDAVCHQAAKVGLGVDFADVRDYVADNDAGTAAGLWALHERRFAGRLVLASSMVVYGEGRYECDEHGPVRPGSRSPADLDAGRWEPPCPTCGRPLRWAEVDEDAPLEPANVYAATKVHQEHLCATFGRALAVPVTMLRYHNVYGPRMPLDTPYAGVAAIFRSALVGGRAPKVFEDGGQRRDFVHVTDVARANVAALSADPPVTGPCNVASGDPRTVLDMARALADAFGAGGPRPVVVGGSRPGDVRHIVASPQRARRLLGFSARVPFADGMAELAALGSDDRG